MGCLIWVKFVEIPKQKFESQLNVIYLFFFSDKVRCFNQSERALYGNFIIMSNTIEVIINLELQWASKVFRHLAVK